MGGKGAPAAPAPAAAAAAAVLGLAPRRTATLVQHRDGLARPHPRPGSAGHEPREGARQERGRPLDGGGPQFPNRQRLQNSQPDDDNNTSIPYPPKSHLQEPFPLQCLSEAPRRRSSREPAPRPDLGAAPFLPIAYSGLEKKKSACAHEQAGRIRTQAAGARRPPREAAEEGDGTLARWRPGERPRAPRGGRRRWP